MLMESSLASNTVVVSCGLGPVLCLSCLQAACAGLSQHVGGIASNVLSTCRIYNDGCRKIKEQSRCSHGGRPNMTGCCTGADAETPQGTGTVPPGSPWADVGTTCFDSNV